MSLVSLLLAASAAPALAGERRWTARADAVGRLNPPGLLASAGVDWRRPADAGRESPALQGGLSAGSSPAYVQAGAHAEWTPLAPLLLRLRYDLYGYYGANDGLLSFPSASAPYGDRERDALSGREEAKLSRRVMISPTLRAKIGRLVLRNQTDMARYYFSGRGPFFLELDNDVLLKAEDDLLANRTQVLWELAPRREGRSLLAGPFHEYLGTRRTSLKHHRAGGMFLWRSRSAWHGLNNPRVYGVVGVHADDPNRKGRVFAQFGAGADF